MKYFEIDIARDLLYPKIECYQMNVFATIQAAIDSGSVDEKFRTLPLWRKVTKNPIKAKGFFTKLLAGLFSGQGTLDEINIDIQTGIVSFEPSINLMFFSANNKQLEIIAQYIKEALPNFEVLLLNGSSKYNGQKITNRNLEQITKEVISKGKSTLIIAANMAQRSFSIPEITNIFLCYDNGGISSTIQRISRALTPNKEGKIGRIYSLSFDPNRDDKFDSLVIETALNYKKRNTDIKSLRQSSGVVLKTVDIFSCTENGAIKMDNDTYLEKALARNGISRTVGKTVNLSKLSKEDLQALAQGNTSYFRNPKQDKSLMGKTSDSQEKDDTESGLVTKKLTKSDVAKARETIVNIVERLNILIMSSDCEYLIDAINGLDNPEDREWILDVFGVDLDIIIFLFDEKVINQDLVELLVEKG